MSVTRDGPITFIHLARDLLRVSRSLHRKDRYDIRSFSDHMNCSHCEKCCQETEMELSLFDIRRLERRGYGRDDFCFCGVDGIYRLRNVGVWCFFYDHEKKRCKEYVARPLGCFLYPVNLSDDGGIVIDVLCPESHTLSAKEIEAKGKRLKSLLRTIDSEAGNERAKKKIDPSLR